MAEIKSTLDIVLEKTKNLRISEEEKKILREKDLTGKIRGMIQRYLDGLIPLDALQADLDQEVKDAPARQLLVVELLERIGACPQGENEKILTVFERISAGKARLIRKLLEQWRQTLDSAREDQLEKIKISLKEKGLSGSALVPNLEKDAQWQSRFQESRSRFRKAAQEIATKSSPDT